MNQCSNIRIERIKANIKQGDLANRLNISPQYLRKLEKNEANPSRDLMLRIAKELDTNVMDLFFDEQ